MKQAEVNTAKIILGAFIFAIPYMISLKFLVPPMPEGPVLIAVFAGLFLSCFLGGFIATKYF